MAQRPYLSTDPNAGLEPSPQPQYLSTDPNAGLTADEESLPERLGLYETAGGLAGGLVGSLVAGAGAIPGAMIGAGTVRLVRGLRRREDPSSLAVGTLGTTALEGLPVVGKIIKAVGRAGVTSALPIVEAAAKALGKRGPLLSPSVTKGVTEWAPLSRGQEEIIQRTLDAPGIRLQKMVNRGGQKISQLGAQRQRIVQGIEDYIDPRPILERSSELVSPAGDVGRNMAASNSAARQAFRKFEKRVLADEGPPRSLAATELDEILRGTRFEKGGPALPGAKAGAAELRTAMSQTLKAADPTGELGRVMREQERMQFLQPIWDRALAAAKGTRKIQPELLVSGATPRAFVMIPAPRRTAFALGKGAYRLGQPLESRFLPGAMRAVPEGLEELYEFLIEQELRKRSTP